MPILGGVSPIGSRLRLLPVRATTHQRSGERGQPVRRTTEAPAQAPSDISFACCAMLQALVDSYGGDTHRLLTDLADVIGANVAYVDRPTVEAHLERPLSDHDWAATAQQCTAMAFDDHVGDAGSLRTDWIEDVLATAGVPGRGQAGQPVVLPPMGSA